ncbi:type II toxin-antitoxin system PemK/MazF family toxin [Sphingomonas sp.]|uniref:type II toxin-antitoxin system PemK/MazF family toxin n=1 Tax=Sphingomonas sp. TaxID=28214 RepID=UPI002E2F8103|nr:type II toxin-antitoxin system PemK/MazF family toxin [Sphingomonas sp.]HEX4695016.1 type II toxin-antitoxin system PemK/MazF family toxin [Sphingomonas sp.]
MKRGDVWLVALDPTVGTEIQKTRPCVIISPDEMNGILRRTIVAPITSGSHPAPFRAAVTFRPRPGLILLDQIRTVDRQRLIKKVGTVEDATLAAVLDILTGMFAG